MTAGKVKKMRESKMEKFLSGFNAFSDRFFGTEEAPDELLIEEIPITPSVRRSPVKRAPIEQASAEQAPAEQTPTERASAEKAPTERTSAEETPAEETPAEETPAEETITEQASAEKTPAEQAATKQASAEKASAEQSPLKKRMTKDIISGKLDIFLNISVLKLWRRNREQGYIILSLVTQSYVCG